MGRPAAGRRPGRSARRSALSEKVQCALLRIRGNRLEQAARLRIAGGPGRQISAILLGQGVPIHSERHPLPERDLERAAVDQLPLQQCLSRRARTAPFRAAALGKLRASWNMNPPGMSALRSGKEVFPGFNRITLDTGTIEKRLACWASRWSLAPCS